MNRSRIIVLVFAAMAAGAAALLARGFLSGGGTEPGKAQPAALNLATVGVLVASTNIEPGRPLTPDLVRWQAWPKSTVDSTFLTQDANPNPDQIVKGTVARTPIASGEPLTNTKIVHSDAAGFMAANVSPGMRAVSIPITTESGAGGFILPNDRVDLILTVQVSDQPRAFGANTILHYIRVLAVDQTYTQDKDQKTVLAKTATLELSPQQAEAVDAAAQTGTVSLALRPLGDTAVADIQKKVPQNRVVAVIRYGLVHGGMGAAPAASSPVSASVSTQAR
ncbi:MAG TPA: Flp pilus assembly protein CpaB [Rhizomicrobium sp.]|jgi:pilus assembly protein CpaB|nr:Flp pilus assembly protein CpaB [Rhizomicrobium sp.]